MTSINFPTDYESILNRIRAINPIKYATTRNLKGGALSYLSPYISRGVISLPQIEQIVLEKYKPEDCEKFFQELAWREYFQRVWQEKGDAIFSYLKTTQSRGIHNQLPASVLAASTGVNSIDEHISSLYDTGYMHNHWRMYTASICCNFANTKWQQGAKWLYYHLLDADLASNHLSWQWVAGSFSKAPYIFNQENLNKYSRSQQRNTFLDVDYAALPLQKIPDVLQEKIALDLKTILPPTTLPQINTQQPILLFTPYNLDPEWRKEEAANRVLVLAPSHFEAFPMAEKTIHFMIELAKNIPQLQVHCGEVEDIPHIDKLQFISKEHPAFSFPGEQDQRAWMHPTVSGYYPSFFAYQKAVEKQQRKR